MTNQASTLGRQKKILFLFLFGVINAFALYLLVTRMEKSTFFQKIQIPKKRLVLTSNQQQSSGTNRISFINKLQRREDLWEEIAQYNADNQKKEERRLPKVIGIGVKKCGTGGIIRFLNHHPLIKSPEQMEMFFFNSEKINYESYRKRMPPTNEQQITMEKTPMYFNGAPENIPDRIKSGIPDAKLILIVCDPTSRSFSDYVHERIRFTYYGEKMVSKYETFDEYVDDYLPKVQSRITELKTKNATHDVGNLREHIIKFGKTDPATMILTNGLYTAHIGRWKSVFNESNLKIIEGKQFLEDPGAIMEDLQDFIGLPKLLLREDFVKRPDTGFYCYRRFTEEHLRNQASNTTGGLNCLGGKGRTRNNQKAVSEATLKKLRDFYRPFNQQFYEDVGVDYGWL